MSPKTTRLPVGLSALGLFGYAALRVASAGDPPATPGRPATPPVASANAPSATTVLLLYNGRVLQGEVGEEGPDYVLRQKGGVIRFRKDQVVKAFDSLTSLYAYKRSEIPDRDPDEHLKLARWCLSQDLREEAKAELRLVTKFSPKSSEAKDMLASIAADDARGVVPNAVDREVVQTAAQAETPGVDGRPGELDSTLFRNASRAMGVSGLPVVFDLPAAVAVKRADEFAMYIHPVLQNACARCHNETHDGAFQLIEVKTRKALTPAVVRANLDFTLKLVDRDNPLKSQLLSSALMPHPGTPGGRPIFPGSNDPKFKWLSAWVLSLRSAAPRTDAGVAQARGAIDTPPPTSGFAADRAKPPLPFMRTPSTVGTATVVDPPALSPDGLPSNVRRDVVAPPPTRYDPKQGRMVVEKAPPPSGEFPDPFMRDVVPKPQAATGPGKLPPHLLPEYDYSQVPVAPPLPTAVPTPGAPKPSETPAAGADKAKTPAKAVKIPADLLEKALMNRNQGR